MKYLLIANPISGSRANSKGEQLSKIIKLLEKKGHSATLRTTEHKGHGYEIALENLHSDYDVIVAIGGDGTVNEVAHALVGSEKILGIIPNGSGNGLARELLLPINTLEAVETLLQHDVATIDTCRVNDEPFFVTCGIGFDGKITKEFAKSNTRGLTTYAKEAISEYFDYTPHEYHITIDGEELVTTAFIVAVGNASQYGNNAFIAPNASITDGLLDLTILKPFPHLEAVKVVAQLFTKGLVHNDYTDLYKGKHITIETTKKTNYHLDGEARSKTNQLDIEVVPASLHVICGHKESGTLTVIDFFHEVANTLHQFRTNIIDRLK